MFEDDDDDEVRGAGDNIASDKRLLLLIQRVETLNEEIKGIQDDRKEVFAEARAVGYDVKIMRKIIADRKKARDDLAEERMVYDTYACAIGLMFE